MGVKQVGQYRVVERLGTGGMGTVFRATDDMLGREVALKVLRAGLEDCTARFRAEAAALARLNHPAIATVYELFNDDERLVMAMELVRGQTLQHIVDHVGVFSPRGAAELCMQTLAGLEHAHASGVVHRDLKPGNLMLTQAGAIKIMDFGIARLEGSPDLTDAGAMIGTPSYMAPEQVRGHAVDARTDLYAMGIVFFRLVTGRLPFTAETSFEMAQAQLTATPAKAGDIRGDLPGWVDEILVRALAKAPADRFQSATEFHEAFARAIADAAGPASHEPGAVTEVLQQPEVAKTRRRGFGWVAAAAIAAVAASLWIILPAAFTNERTGSSPPDTIGVAGPAAAGARAQMPPPDGLPARIDTANATRPVAKRPSLPPVSFTEMKLLTVDGSRTSTSDVHVELAADQVQVRSRDGRTTLASLGYQRIAKATYTHARDPKWAAGLSGPSGSLDVPGVFGRARHWLVLQAKSGYVIFRLDGGERLALMQALEARGVPIDRAAAKRPG